MPIVIYTCVFCFEVCEMKWSTEQHIYRLMVVVYVSCSAMSLWEGQEAQQARFGVICKSLEREKDTPGRMSSPLILGNKASNELSQLKTQVLSPGSL